MVTGYISSTVNYGVVPFEVLFTMNLTSGDPVSYNWDFGDGEFSTSISDLLVNQRMHTYYIQGINRVAVTIEESDGSLTVITKDPDGKDFIIRGASIDFTANKVRGSSPLEVQFSTLDYLPHGLVYSSMRWDFGDGSTGSTERDPLHIYSQVADYNVSLEVSLTEV